MTNRKKKIKLIQFIIFFTAILLLYNTYRNKSEQTLDVKKIEAKSDLNTNSFTDIEYSGFDLSGNRYILNAVEADFKSETPELINMKGVFANFYLKDNTILNITSNEGIYNNLTLDIQFKENVKAVYLDNTLRSNYLDYSNSNGKLLATGNVRGESVEKGKFIADNVEYDLTSKDLNFSMLGNKQVNVKIKN